MTVEIKKRFLVLRIFDIFDFFSCHSLYAGTSVVSKNLLVPPLLYSNTQKQPKFLEITSKAQSFTIE